MKFFKTITVVLLLITTAACGQTSEAKITKEETKPDYSKVDYSARSNIIKRPKELTGDEKAIFYHPYFLKLTHEEAKNLEPLKVKEEFAKLGITVKEKERFQTAYSFFMSKYTSHKKSCENFAYYNFLKPKSQN